MKYVITFSILSFIVSALYYIFFQYTVLQLCDLQTCPFCFGNDLCKEIEENKIILQFNSITYFIFNVFSVKNVFFALYKGKKVVLKKLAHSNELRNFDKFTKSDNYEQILDFLVCESGTGHFKICDKNSAKLFLKKLNYKDFRNVQTLIKLNIEPILLDIFNSRDGWCVPKLYGFCGRLAIMENAGQSLDYVENFNWFDRAYIAFQLLQAAINFTDNHQSFRLYLTDISPDNIVFNEDLRISFVDLENAILKKKTENGTPHYTEHFDEESYIYSEKQICESSVSDHNIYAVCRLLLSKNAPWPMMKNGLLHTPPKMILETYSEVFKHIELCVYSVNKIDRFKLSDKILYELNAILKKYTNHVK